MERTQKLSNQKYDLGCTLGILFFFFGFFKNFFIEWDSILKKMRCAQKLCIAIDLSYTLREYLRTWTNTQNIAKKGKESMCSYT